MFTKEYKVRQLCLIVFEHFNVQTTYFKVNKVICTQHKLGSSSLRRAHRYTLLTAAEYVAIHIKLPASDTFVKLMIADICICVSAFMCVLQGHR